MPAGDQSDLTECLKRIGQSPGRVTEQADSDSIEQAYEAATNEARSLGIFGTPTFVVDGHELFWGNDRLEDAIDFWRGDGTSD